jgi:lysophospholipid acyltransferase (LPLAT)-like uncharacterized protein
VLDPGGSAPYDAGVNGGAARDNRDDAADRPGGIAGRLVLAVAPALAAILIRALRATLRLRHVGRGPLDDLDRRGVPYILAFWHGRLLLMPYAYRRGRIAILISRHRDGELIARTMGWFGHESIRDSTTRGGTAALRAAVRRLERGADVGWTPDGPRGPRFRVQGGIIQAARLSGAPIVPVVFSAAPAKRFASWDRFLLPLPLGRGAFHYGEPLRVPRDADPAAQERLRVQLEATLRGLTQAADGQPLDDAAPRP